MCFNAEYESHVMVLSSKIMPQSYIDVDRSFMTMNVMNLIERGGVHDY